MPLKGVFFDLYGTLLVPTNNKKAWSHWLSTFHRLMKKYGLKISKRNFAELCSGFFIRSKPIELDEDLTIYENRIKKFATDLNTELNKI